MPGKRKLLAEVLALYYFLPSYFFLVIFLVMLPIIVVFMDPPLRIGLQMGDFYLDFSILLGSQPCEQKNHSFPLVAGSDTAIPSSGFRLHCSNLVICDCQGLITAVT